MFIERYFENMNKNDCKKEQDDFQIKLIKRTCYFPPCLTRIMVLYITRILFKYVFHKVLMLDYLSYTFYH